MKEKALVLGTTLFTMAGTSFPVVNLVPGSAVGWLKIRAIGLGGTLEVSGISIASGLTAGQNPFLFQGDGWLDINGNPPLWLKASGTSGCQVAVIYGKNSAS